MFPQVLTRNLNRMSDTIFSRAGSESFFAFDVILLLFVLIKLRYEKYEQVVKEFIHIVLSVFFIRFVHILNKKWWYIKVNFFRLISC